MDLNPLIWIRNFKSPQTNSQNPHLNSKQKENPNMTKFMTPVPIPLNLDQIFISPHKSFTIHQKLIP